MTQRLRSRRAASLSVLPGGLAPVAGASGSSKRPLLVCFSHLRWDFVWQRPQHLMVRAVEGYDVLFLEEPIWRNVAEPHLEVTPRSPGIRVAVPVLPEGTGGADANAAQRDLIDRLLADERRRVGLAWYYTPMAVAFSDHLVSDLVVYDNMDELSAFRGASPEMLANEAALFDLADLVFTGGRSLYEAKRDRHPHVTAFPSSIDAPHFAAARNALPEEPADQASIPHPRLGFFGVIDERMDLDLVAEVARLRPHWHLVMIGPVVKIDPASLPRGGNVHWIGHKGYDELPAYLAGWDVGLMPFAMNESTRFISPTKTPEYLAAGIPVISAPIADVVRPYGEIGLVEIAATAEEVVLAAETIMGRAKASWLAAVDHHLATSSWDRTWDEMLDVIEEAEERAEGSPAIRKAAAGLA